MKITKTSASVLLIAFLIGYASVPTPQTKQIVAETPSDVSTDSPAAPPFCIKGEPETVEENNNWDYEENYPFKIKLLETGEVFHGDEVAAEDGETWLGLFKAENGKHFLRPTKIKIRRVHDQIVNDEKKYPKRKTGKSVGTDDKTAPLFLLKNAENLRAGEITTLFRGVTVEEIVEYSDEMTKLKKGFFHEYEIGGKKYTLQVKEAKTGDGKKILALILEGAGRRQILHTVNQAEYSEELGALFWVGDLDRDRKPDFYMELYINDNMDYKNLFLSAPASKGKLVKKSAYFWTTGC
ncbi:MAG TPA: hypothetical protein VF721_11115 [Pyrinomonadaceae bacterium]|jgi:hypothetical protein